MSNISRVKVYRNTSVGPPEVQFKDMLYRFKKQCNYYGINSLCKKYEYYESKNEKKRKKRNSS